MEFVIADLMHFASVGIVVACADTMSWNRPSSGMRLLEVLGGW